MRIGTMGGADLSAAGFSPTGSGRTTVFSSIFESSFFGIPFLLYARADFCANLIIQKEMWRFTYRIFLMLLMGDSRPVKQILHHFL